LRGTAPAPRQEGGRYPGQSSHEEAARRRVNGIPLHPDLVKWFDEMSRALSTRRLERI
jgi:LDH2 family malate/lactate/ureidoglycolate dehydrogenase